MKKSAKVFLTVFAVLCSVMFISGAESKAAETQVSPTEVVLGTENVTQKTYTYSVPVKTYSGSQATIVPVSVNKQGELYIRINSSTLASDVKLSLWKDAAAEQYPAAGTYDSYFTASPSEVKEDSVSIASADVYYLRIEYNYEGSSEGQINLSFYNVSSEERTLKSDTWSALASAYNSRVTYAKVTIASNGYIGITQTNTKGNSMTVALCNSQKTELASKYLEANKAYYYPVKKGTYYLKTSATSTISFLKYSQKSVFSVTQNKSLTVPLMGTSVFDVKIKAEKTGLLSLKQYNSTSWYCTFLNAKKKALSDDLWNWGDVNSIAVKKGQTYYFRINASIGSDDRVLSYSIAGAKAVKNTSAKKAVVLKKGKKQSALILSGDSKWHYFKLKLSKKQVLNMYYSAAGNGKYKYQLKKGKRTYVISADNSKNKLYSYSKLSKGTYYLMIKAESKSSGKFTMKLK